MEDGGWVYVRQPTEKDQWNPSSMEAESSTPQPLKITFTEPAKHWTDALPIGNGRLGAMVWGGVVSETLQLNEDTLWTGTPSNYTNTSAPEVLSEVRKLVDDGKYAEATAEAVKLTGNPAEVYQLLGDLKLEFDASHLTFAEETYHRELDLDTATVRVKYSVGDVEFTREHFASNPNQVIVTKISGSKPGSLSFSVSLDSKLYHHSYINGKSQIIMEGSCPGKRIPPAVDANDEPKGIQFSAVLDLQISDDRGVIHILDDKQLRVEGSDWAVLLLVASSSFDGPFTKPSDSKRNPTSESLSALKPMRDLSYYDLYAHHLDDYQNLFHRVSLQLMKNLKNNKSNGSLELKKLARSVTGLYLKGSEDNMVSTAARVKSFQTDEDPSLVELLFQYGRYLLISCSRPRTQVANLQGLWNKDIQPKWDGAPHLNINLEMNYWPSLPCNLSECQEPLFDFISSLSTNGRKTAEVNYEANGWVVHHKSDIWAKSSADQGDVEWALWPMGGAWLCTHIWDHYAYTMDKDFLKVKAYPLLDGCASFLLDWLIEGRGGYLETNPSTSPEHNFVAPDGKPACVSYSSTMDMAIIREVFAAVVSAAENFDNRFWTEMKMSLLKECAWLYQGCIQQKFLEMVPLWNGQAQDFGDADVHHRHLSHLFGLFPGHTITVEKAPDLCQAAEISLYKRGEDGPGWSTTWKAALWARLDNSEHAYRMVKKLINLVDPDNEEPFEGGLYSNLFAAHPPFQIDANFGFTAAVSEMLVQSTIKDLYFLPALPRDKWANGCVKGLKARGAVTVSICWKEGDLHEVGLWSKEQNSLKRLHYRGTIVTASILSGIIYTFNAQLKCVKTCSL
ncbi:alpha-L-fucosidase 2-like isoform X1 [Corylus avellana]|uniref:alpha-L-fucosidase 2-like isoform X1 n=1 Tax=Corylus avellana TaxID=13451 RepID=UPI00286A9952|nr:alpha-L-fucosidase 2-like isoform X1 [Corylus avellana]